jgi:MATE family multidrug resistance protein
MGVEGAAIGTLIARVFMLLYLVFYFIKTPIFNKYFDDYKKIILEFNLISKIIKLGTPSALQMLFEVGFFTAAIWLSGFLGKVSQAANQIALNLSTISYMVAMGLSVTAMIRVGNQFGKLDIKELKRIAYSIFILIFLFDIIFCLIFLIFNDSLPWIYLDSGNEININDTLQVIKLASTLLIISAIFQVSDGIQVVVLGSLKGIQDVNIPTAITFFSYWIIGFPISYYLGLKTSLGSIGIWIGLLAGLTVSAILLLARFNYKLKELLKR